VEKSARARLGGERLVLGHAMLDQLRVVARDLGMARGTRVAPVLEQERRQPRQRARMIVSVDRAVHRVTRERAEIVREPVRIDAFALDEAGIAEGSLLGRPAPIDENHGARALLKMQRRADADDPGTEDNDIRSHHTEPGVG
jgi:hypothetical protein